MPKTEDKLHMTQTEREFLRVIAFERIHGAKTGTILRLHRGDMLAERIIEENP